MSLFRKRKPEKTASADHASAGRNMTTQSADTIINQTLLKETSESAPPIDRRFNLQPPPESFTGRQPLINSILGSLGEGVSIHAAAGMGGIGKTALARLVAHHPDVKPNYPDARIEIDLRGAVGNTDDAHDPLQPARAMEQVIHAFHPDAMLPDDPAQISGIYHNLLAEKRIILLLDNARDADQVAPLIPPAPSLTLITSRQRFDLPALTRHDIEQLTDGEARALLARLTQGKRQDLTESQTTRLLQLCGNLPLAIEVSAAALNVHDDLPADDYLTRFTDDPGDRINASIVASISLLDDELRDRFLALSVFPGGDADFNAAAAAAVWNLTQKDEDGHDVLDAPAARTTLSDLRAFSLVHWDPESERYDLHDLIRRFTANQITTDARAGAEARFCDYFAHLIGAADDLFEKGHDSVLRALAIFDTERANVDAAFELIEPRVAAADHAAAKTCGALVGRTPNLQSLRLHPRVRIRWHEAYLVGARLLSNRMAEGTALGNLGNAYKNLGDAKRAIEFYEQSLAIARLLSNRLGEGTALGNLGVAYGALGDAKRAIEFYEQSLAIAREIGDRRGEGTALGNLGNAYKNLGDAKRAIEFYEQSLAIAREIGNRRGEGIGLGNLGNAYSALGDAKRAIEFYEQSLAIARDFGDRRGEGTALGNLGNAYKNLGDAKRAIEFYEQSLAIAREIGDRRGEGIGLGNLGAAYADLGDAKRAIEFYEQRLAIARDFGDRRGEGTTLGNLGNAYSVLGDAKRAIEFYEQDLAIAGEIGDRRGEATAWWNLGSQLANLGRFPEAVYHMQRYVDFLYEIGHPDADKHAADVAKLRAQLDTENPPHDSGEDPSPDSPDSPLPPVTP